MPCRDALLRIADLLEGRLPPEAREDLDHHLAGCDDCRSALIDARAGTGALADFARAEAARPVRPTDVGAILAMAQLRGDESPPAAVASAAQPEPRPVAARVRRVAAVLLMALGLASLAGTDARYDDGRLQLTCRLPGFGAPAGVPVAGSPASTGFDRLPASGGAAGSSDLWQEAERALLAADGSPATSVAASHPVDLDLDSRIGNALDERLYPLMARFSTVLEEGDARRTEALILLLERQAADNKRALDLLRRVTPFDPNQPAILMPVAGPARRLKQ